MKTNLLYIVFSLLFISSCNKDSNEKKVELFGLTGKWEWVSTTSGIVPITTTPSSTGK